MPEPLLTRGATGPAVKTMQQGLHKILGAAAQNLSNGTYGSLTVADVVLFKRTHGILADGTIWGSTAWRVLDAVLAALPQPIAAQEQAKRDALKAEALWLIAHAGQFVYAQQRPMPVPPDLHVVANEDRWDCSSTVTAIYHKAGCPDPNGSRYNGYGNTWSLVARGKWISAVHVGDLLFYGPAMDNPTHVAICIGAPNLVSFGHTPPTEYGSFHYRPDYLGAKAYPLL